MDLIDNLALGFATALTLQNLMYAVVGCLTGTLIGVLPGLGPLATIAMLLPFTYSLAPTGALILLASIYYGAQYGGSTTAILLKIPGESSSIVTTVDGYAMARKGRAGPALAAAAIGSFVAGSFGVLVLAGLAQPLTKVAFLFGPAEYFSLMLLGLVGSITLSSDAIDKSLGLMVLGLALSTVGMDVNSGTIRFTEDIPELMDGIELTALAMGVFGLAEIVTNLEERRRQQAPGGVAAVGRLLPSRADVRRMTPSILRGTLVGSVLGILPGAGVTLASFAGYAVEKKFSRHAGEMGQGAIEGVAGPESANNAAAQTNFISLLTLGIPGSAVMALMLGAMVIQNIQPGPRVITSHPEVFWGLVVSMWIGNLMLVVLNLPLVGIWVRLLRIPYHLLFPAILVFCAVGAYAVRNSVLDVYLLAGFGVLGYALFKLAISPVPLLMGLVLGPMLEASFRRAMTVSRGSFATFVDRPLSLALLAATVLLIAAGVAGAARQRRLGAASTDVPAA
ncbi:tripartite tricarboxylate transporter permease [Xanthobacter sp. V4C-4]|uniref:tripartite tricarboxylate transporter permease n=1 Tax=Xanthobacter cornucopiae TaxID=3119924 RepID=UPI0037286FBB